VEHVDRFLAAAGFAIVATVIAWLVINVKKEDLPSDPEAIVVA